MDLGIQKKIALVMSSSRGLGEGIAKSLASEGVHVLLSGRNKDRLSEIVDEIDMPENDFKLNNYGKVIINGEKN